MAAKGVRVNAERDLAIHKERKEQGTTFAALGQKYGLTPARVRQIVVRHDHILERRAGFNALRKQREGANHGG